MNGVAATAGTEGLVPLLLPTSRLADSADRLADSAVTVDEGRGQLTYGMWMGCAEKLERLPYLSHDL